MAKLALETMLSNNRCGITATDNNGCTVLRRLYGRIQQ